jgi:hypothetical protein
VTLIEQEEDAATLDPHVFVSEKLLPAAMLEMLRGALPVFLRVTLCALLAEPTAWVANVKDVGERLATGKAPVPVRPIVWVAGLALSVMVTEPVRVPVTRGVKVMLIGQEAPEARLEPQLLVWEKSPLATMLVMLRAAVPLFWSVTLCGLLLESIGCGANVKVVAERFAVGAVPVPARLTV